MKLSTKSLGINVPNRHFYLGVYKNKIKIWYIHDEFRDGDKSNKRATQFEKV
jgi:hypothetical protein